MHYGKPTEPVWSNLKRSLANLVEQDIGELTALVKTRLRRMQYQLGGLPGQDQTRPHAPSVTSTIEIVRRSFPGSIGVRHLSAAQAFRRP